MTKQLHTHLNDAMQQAISRRLANLNTCTPGIIQSYNPATQTANISFVYPQKVMDQEGVVNNAAPIVLPNVPIMMIGGVAGYLSIPVAVGDTCLLLFCQHSINTWKATGGIVDVVGNNSAGLRGHNLNDAVALVGIISQDKTVAGSNSVVLYGSTIAIGNGSVEAINTIGNALLEMGSAFALSGNVALSAIATSITSAGTALVSIAGSF